jgi:hypothetical protein
LAISSRIAFQLRRESAAPDVERLVAQVIELQDDGIGLAAVNARMRDEEVEEEAGALELKARRL